MTKIMRKIKEDDIMTLKSFIGLCREGNFIDYDGFGYLSDGKIADESVMIWPSDARERDFDTKGYTHILWFNR